MISHIFDAVLLIALVLTALRVGAMHRELRRLRGYQDQYVQVFGETSRAADNIGNAVRHIGGAGREVLVRLETAIAKAEALSKRLETMARAGAAQKQRASAPAAPKAAAVAAPKPAVRSATSEILSFPTDSRPLRERKSDAQPSAAAQPVRRAVRAVPVAPLVEQLREALGNG